MLGQTRRKTLVGLVNDEAEIFMGGYIVALVANFFMPALAEPVVEQDDNKDDATPVSEQKDLKTLEEEEKDANDKAKLAALRLRMKKSRLCRL